MGVDAAVERVAVVRVDCADDWAEHGVLFVVHGVSGAEFARVQQQVYLDGAARVWGAAVGRVHEVLGVHVLLGDGVAHCDEERGKETLWRLGAMGFGLIIRNKGAVAHG